MSAPTRERPSIALLLDNMFEGYEAHVWRRISEAAQAEDVNLICFLAGPARGQRLQRIVFDLPSKETVDGIIGLFGTLNLGTDWYVPPAAENTGWNANAPGCYSEGEVQGFLRRYAGLPVVSIGKLIAGVPTLMVDNETGVEQVLSHLIEVHGRRRIAFICGPEGNDEAQARLRGYRAALERHGIPFDPALLCPGDFTMFAGSQAVRGLIDDRHVQFDALMAANDLMAIEGMLELQRRGLRVPEELSVVGFDDYPGAASTTPPLTTVTQPLQALADAAMHQVLAMIRGGAAPENTVLPTRPVYRRSCGCLGTADHGWDVPVLPAEVQTAPRAAWGAGITSALEAANPWLPTLPGGSCAAALVEALCAELEGGSPGFLVQLDAAVSAGMGVGVPPLRWRGLLLGAFEAVRTRAAPDGQRLLALVSRSSAMLGERAEYFQTKRAQDLEFEAFILQQIFRVTGVEEHDFTSALQAQLPNLGVKSFYLARLVDSTVGTATLDFHYGLDGVVSLDPVLGLYPARRLVPGRFTERSRWSYVVMPLHFGAEVTGFVVCGGSDMSGPGYEALANQLGRAYKARTLVKEAQLHAAELELRVEERARQLKEAQQQMIDIAHEAGMAEIAVGALHNIGNVLNSIGVSAEATMSSASEERVISGMSRFVELLQAHRSDLPGFFTTDPRAALVPEYGQQLLAAMKDAKDRICAEAGDLLSNVALVRETVVTLQDLARKGQDELLVEPVDLAVLVEVALKLQAANIARQHVQIHRRMTPVPPVLAQRFKVIHVLVNLIKNAVEAMQRTAEPERALTVELSPRVGGGAVLKVADTGEGIPADKLERIFVFGFTTKPEGHGFGLHACANYIHQMGGRILVESEGSGKGACFSVELPG